MRRNFGFLACFLVCGVLWGQMAAAAQKPFVKVAVLDFVTADSIGLKQLAKLSAAEDAERKAQTDEDASMGGVMQGIVKLLDGASKAAADESKWDAQRRLFLDTVKGSSRPAILGADYLAAYLGRHKDVFGCIDGAIVEKAMLKLSKEDEDFPKDFLKKLAAETGATHIIYGTVSDIRSKENAFKGYGIETKTTLCQLDVIIKVVDLAAQHTTFSNVYTGSYKEQRPISVEQFDNNIYQNLMTSALEQAAEELYEDALLQKENNKDE